MQASPICFITCETLLADDPAAKIAKDNRKFPAQIFVPAISCWLFQTKSFLHSGFWQLVVIVTIVPTCDTFSKGSL